jgi:hypothetical protein
MSEETIPQMREQIDNLTKSNKDLISSNEKLVSENRGFAARDAFRDEGYAANHGDLYAAANPEGDITTDGVNEFAGQFNLQKIEPESKGSGSDDGSDEGGDDTDGDAPGSTALADMQRGSSSSGDGSGGAGPEKMTQAEWQALHQTDPAAAKEAVRQGRVVISKDNPWLDGKPVQPGMNPYAPQALPTDKK